MTTWTATARQELEEHLAGLRRSLAGSGADPDEVVDDMRRHVAEEASAARLPVVTEEDVRRFMSRVAPPMSWRSLRRDAAGGGGNGNRNGNADRNRAGEVSKGTGVSEGGGGSGNAGKRWRSLWSTGALWLFGVLLPLGTLVFELVTRACAAEFFDPIPTVWHGLMVALVPLANAMALGLREGAGAGWRRVVWWMNGAAIGVGLVYAIPFAPLLPLALVGVMFGLGFLPLAPLLSVVAGAVLRRRLAAGGVMPGWRRENPLAAALAVLVLFGYMVPGLLTRHYARRAIQGDAVASQTAVEWLRRWGHHELLLRESYGQNRAFWTGTWFERIPEETARELYFRVTGEPYNAVQPPASAWSRSHRVWTDDREFGGAEWDSALGTEAVAGRVRGLSMVSSRMDAMADADAAWSYVEWTMEFRNDHERMQREARAQIQLPPGGVVSRLTLWVNGEEREAAFSGRGHVREAYQKVAVQQRRDPVLVTTSGPDRVLMQCFPVPPGGGTMKVRLGITAPLVVRGGDASDAAMVWPRFLERNFGQSGLLRHGIWLDLPEGRVREAGDLAVVAGAGGEGRTGWRGEWTDARLGEDGRVLWLRRDGSVREQVAPDRMSEGGGWVRQRVLAAGKAGVRRVAVVVDGSVNMAAHVEAVADALQGAPEGPEIAVFVVRDGVVRLPGDGREASVTGALRGLRCEGGQDGVAGLEAAWDWAAEQPGSWVCWVHGPHPVLLGSAEPLRQRMERHRGGAAPKVWDLPVKPGPNRVLEKMDGLTGMVPVPRLGALAEDIGHLLAVAAGRVPSWELVRDHLGAGEPAAGIARASAHVTRLWANGEVQRLGQARAVSAAVALAARHQLVTSHSGAVVLETLEQYKQSGLQPVDPTTVPVVPEPGAGWILLLGALLLWGRRRGGRRAAAGIGTA